MSTVHAETALAGGYVLFLLAVALGLEALARHSHARAQRFRTAGFSYERHLDLWVCPEGEHLHRHETDHARGIGYYRAHAHACNACALKPRCTDSDTGREIARALDPWPHSESGRFHRGLCLVPIAIGVLILAVVLVRNHAAGDLAAVLALALPLVLTGRHMLVSFLSTPSGFPEPQAVLQPSGGERAIPRSAGGAQMPGEPARGELRDLLEGAGLLEQMGRAGDHD